MPTTPLAHALCVFLVLIAPCLVRAAPLTQAQYDALNTDITVTHQPEFAQAVTDRNYPAIADAYNALSAPPFWVWRTSLGEKEIYEATSSDGTTWDWTTYIQQTVQERDAWGRMFGPGVINPSLAQTRAGYTKIFSGTGAAIVAQRTHLLTLSRRVARRIEALLVLPTGGNGTTATPANMLFEGTIRPVDVGYALGGIPSP
jgi:hypothetical protein